MPKFSNEITTALSLFLMGLNEIELQNKLPLRDEHYLEIYNKGKPLTTHQDYEQVIAVMTWRQGHLKEAYKYLADVLNKNGEQSLDYGAKLKKLQLHQTDENNRITRLLKLCKNKKLRKFSSIHHLKQLPRMQCSLVLTQTVGLHIQDLNSYLVKYIGIKLAANIPSILQDTHGSEKPWPDFIHKIINEQIAEFQGALFLLKESVISETQITKQEVFNVVDDIILLLEEISKDPLLTPLLNSEDSINNLLKTQDFGFALNRLANNLPSILKLFNQPSLKVNLHKELVEWTTVLQLQWHHVKEQLMSNIRFSDQSKFYYNKSEKKVAKEKSESLLQLKRSELQASISNCHFDKIEDFNNLVNLITYYKVLENIFKVEKPLTDLLEAFAIVEKITDSWQLNANKVRVEMGASSVNPSTARLAEINSATTSLRPTDSMPVIHMQRGAPPALSASTGVTWGSALKMIIGIILILAIAATAVGVLGVFLGAAAGGGAAFFGMGFLMDMGLKGPGLVAAFAGIWTGVSAVATGVGVSMKVVYDRKQKQDFSILDPKGMDENSIDTDAVHQDSTVIMPLSSSSPLIDVASAAP